MPASVDLLGQLHDILTAEMIRRIEEGEATAADLSAAIKFLKDNNVVAIQTQGSATATLAEKLKAATQKKQVPSAETHPDSIDLQAALDTMSRGLGMH